MTPAIAMRSRTQAVRAAWLLVAATLVWPVTAHAYRPFDGTDAAVADLGELEVEFQPAGALWEQAQRTLIGAETVLNFGIRPNWEAVLEGQFESPLSPPGPTSFTAAGAFMKGVLRPGRLQDKEGPSIATEFGLLLPDSTGDSGLGASLAGIVSQRWDWGTIHFNAAAALTREHRADLFVGTILEGPATWKVRPVSEIFYENEFGSAETISGLVGLIWRVDDNLSFDVGVRHALTNGHPVSELRAGLTVGFPRALEHLGHR